MHGGGCLVVRPVRNGYLLVFDKTVDAASWSKRLQFEVDRHNERLAVRPGRGQPIPGHNIALGFGPVSRVLRAHGCDYIGGVIDDCIDLASHVHDGLIAMSASFADQYEKHVGKREFTASTGPPVDEAPGRWISLEWP
jgi:hypothetical protein